MDSPYKYNPTKKALMFSMCAITMQNKLTKSVCLGKFIDALT